MIGKLIEKIKSIFERPKEPKYTIKLTPEQWARIPTLTKKQIAELHATVEFWKNKYEKTEKKLKELQGKLKPKEVEVLEEALKQKTQIEAEKRSRRMALIPFRVPRVSSWDEKEFRSGKNKYGYLWGIELEESKTGLSHTISFILKQKPKDKKIFVITPKPSMTIDDFFKIPYVISSFNRRHLRLPVYQDGTNALAIMSNGGNPKLDARRLREAIAKDVAKLKERIEVLEAEKYQLEKQREELEMQVHKLKNELTVAKHRADLANALSMAEAEKIKGMATDMTKILGSGQTSEIDRRLTLGALFDIIEREEALRKRLTTIIGPPVAEVVAQRVRREVKEEFLSLLERVKPLKLVGRKQTPNSLIIEIEGELSTEQIEHLKKVIFDWSFEKVEFDAEPEFKVKISRPRGLAASRRS